MPNESRLLTIYLSGVLLFPLTAYPDINIEITGVDNGLREEILSTVVIANRDSETGMSGARIRALFHRSLSEIEDILKFNGYYEYSVEESLEQSGDDWLAVYQINPGEPVIIRTLNVKIEGAGGSDESLVTLAENFPLSVGDRLHHGDYETGKRRIQTAAREHGYFNAAFTTHEIKLDLDENSAVIDLVFTTGERFVFGEISVEETVVNRERLNGMMPFRQGDPYDVNLLIRLSDNFRDSNYFSEVIVNQDISGNTGNTVPVSVELTPNPKNNYKVGVGYGTDSGPRLLAGWESRYLNPRGQHMEVNIKGSTSLSSLSARHVTPDFLRPGRELDLLSLISRENTDTHTSNTFIVGAQQTQRRGSWNETIGLSYQLENFDIAGEESNSNLLIPSVSYWKTSSKSLIYTRSGYRINLNLKGSAKGALSDVGFGQITVSGKYIHPAGEDGRLIARTELGATTVSDFTDLPASIRYFAGGDNSIRGFDFQSQGPRNANGEVIGGKYLGVGSIEYEHRVYRQIRAAVFTDFGNAFNSTSDPFLYSIGAGLRWLTPVGMIRLDFAFGLSEDPSTFRIHFNIGPDL